MKTIHQKKQEDNKNIIGSVVAGVAGAVAIASIVAATMALKDEKTRKNVKNVLIDMKDHAIDYVDTLKTESNIGEEIRTIKEIATINLIRKLKSDPKSRFNI